MLGKGFTATVSGGHSTRSLQFILKFKFNVGGGGFKKNAAEETQKHIVELD